MAKNGPITDQMRRDVMENVSQFPDQLGKEFSIGKRKRKKDAAGYIRRWSCGILVCPDSGQAVIIL